MKKHNKISISFLSFLLFVITTGFIGINHPMDAGIAIIINSDNPVASMTSSQVKLTYLRKINKRWKEINKNIVPIDRKSNNDTRKAFLQEILDMTSDEMTRFFTEREYQNAEAPPLRFNSDEEIIEYVSENVGAIAYVSKISVKPGSKVKIVLSF